jgi:hypothetical protein
MIIHNCNLLLVIISKIESLIAEKKTQHPYLNDEEIIEFLKIKFSIENRS